MFEEKDMLEQEDDSLLSVSYEDSSDDCVFDIDDDPNSEAKWYVVHTYSGHEKKVKSSIEKIVESKGMENEVLKVNVPTQKIVTVKNASSKKKAKKDNKSDSDVVKSVRDRIIFPGYVFVKMIHNDKTWFLVRNTRGVTGFVAEIYPERQMLKVLISALNNATAELEFSAVTKIKK